MSANFQREFVRRFACTVNLVTGREFDSIGRPADRSACSQCGECTRTADLGIAAQGVRLVGSVSGLDLVWSCPGCGRETTQETTALASINDAAECASDGLCYSCRKVA